MTEQKTIQANSIEWLKDCPSDTFDLIIADPPYNVGKDYGSMIDSINKKEYLEFLSGWTSEAVRVLKPFGSIYTFMGFRFISYLYDILENQCGLYFNSWISWHYTQGQGKRRGFSPRHDDILMFTKHPKKYTFNLDDVRVPQKSYRSINNMRGANPGDVWEFSHIHYCQGNRQEHPTQKPQGLIERMILASSFEGQDILDPFSGSGTTLRVCQQLSRNCIGVEINPKYVDMTKQRLAQPFSGFDSIDPRMKRVPLDLNDIAVRNEYVANHKRWFLTNHETKIEEFEKEVLRIYGELGTERRRGSAKSGRQSKDLFASLKYHHNSVDHF